MLDLVQGGSEGALQRQQALSALCGWPTLNCCPGQSEAAMSVGMGTEEHDQGRRACLSSPSDPEQKCRQHRAVPGLQEKKKSQKD